MEANGIYSEEADLRTLLRMRHNGRVYQMGTGEKEKAGRRTRRWGRSFCAPDACGGDDPPARRWGRSKDWILVGTPRACTLDVIKEHVESAGFGRVVVRSKIPKFRKADWVFRATPPDIRRNIYTLVDDEVRTVDITLFYRKTAGRAHHALTRLAG